MSGTLRTAAQQALETLEQLQGGCTDSADGTVEAITVWCPEVIDALRAALAEPKWTDADADAARLALELEALMLDTKDLAAVSRSWASGHDALELHRQRLRGEMAEDFCDTHCTWADHALGCVRAEQALEPLKQDPTVKFMAPERADRRAP